MTARESCGLSRESKQIIGNNTMQAAKQEALDAIAKLPDDTDMDEIMYRLYVLDKIRMGREAADQGRAVSHEDLKREIETW